LSLQVSNIKAQERFLNLREATINVKMVFAVFSRVLVKNWGKGRAFWGNGKHFTCLKMVNKFAFLPLLLFSSTNVNR